MAPFIKPPATISEHIKRLKDRGMNFSDEDAAACVLSHVTYYRLCSYWLPYEANHTTHQYQKGTTFENIHNDYEFDRNLRLLIMDAIERIEISIRANWVNTIKFSHGPHGHLNSEAFKLQKDKNNVVKWSQHQAVSHLINDHNRSRETYVKHFRKKYDEELPPIWAAAELMTLGSFSKWFSNTKTRQLRNKVAKLYLVDERVLTSFLHHMVTVRNYCAHHARLWNRSFTIRWITPKSNPKHLVQSLCDTEINNPHESKKPYKLYNTLTMLSHLMHIINPATQWHFRVVQLIKNHNIDVSTMGFPKNYENLPTWNGLNAHE